VEALAAFEVPGTLTHRHISEEQKCAVNTPKLALIIAI
jgi:hypothetical protein